MRATLLLLGLMVIGIVAAGSAAAVSAGGSGSCLPGGGSLGSRLDVVSVCLCLDGPSLTVDSDCRFLRP
ncbi:MAG TPA: hypothetical protein VGR28_07990 [Candidatus Thermoplasmatota archaeon]|nr:hypothetical protein [Candidatus Thermoplasmatota archaeon]